MKSDGQLNWDNLTFIRKFYTMFPGAPDTVIRPSPDMYMHDSIVGVTMFSWMFVVHCRGGGIIVPPL